MPKTSKKNKYLFVLIPPFSGSTLVAEMLNTSKNVSIVNERNNMEGQLLPELKEIMFTPDRWKRTTQYPWKMISDVWHKHWDLSKDILLEKSPAHIIRADFLQRLFDPAYFIISVRNPYAHAESLIRRNKTKNMKRVARFIIRSLKVQKNNIEQLERSVFFTYEDFVRDPHAVSKQLVEFMPELGAIDVNKKFKAHNFSGKQRKITDLTAEKIAKLTSAQKDGLNEVFKEHRLIFKYFNYQIIE
jgi:hypothetical protein